LTAIYSRMDLAPVMTIAAVAMLITEFHRRPCTLLYSKVSNYRVPSVSSTEQKDGKNQDNAEFRRGPRKRLRDIAHIEGNFSSGMKVNSALVFLDFLFRAILQINGRKADLGPLKRVIIDVGEKISIPPSSDSVKWSK